jgi:hypothetical protein
VATSPDGIAWFGDSNSGRIYRVTAGLAVESIVVPGALAVNSPVLGPDGNVWFAYLATGGGYYFGRVLTGVLPASTGAPVASGTVALGQALTTTEGNWRYAPTSYAYQWQRCEADDPRTCTDISGSSGPAHAVTAADVGKGVRVRVSATNLNGTAGSVASNILTSATAPSSSITVRKPTRKGYVISTVVEAPGPGTIRQVGTVSGRAAKSELAKKRRPRPTALRACTPKAITFQAAGTRTVKCVLSSRVRTLLRSRKVVVTLKTTFSGRAGGTTTVTRRITVPRIAKKR